MAMTQTRRGFLSAMSAAGALGLFGAPRVLAAEGPLETTSVRLFKTSLICSAAPQFAAEGLLRAEGFEEIEYVDAPRAELAQVFSDGMVDFRRVMRAILKATDLCAQEPARVAQNISNRGLTRRYDYDRQALSELPYYRWREYNAEDTVRFYSLQLYEAGLIKAIPSKIMAENTDLHFFDELKRELKA